MGYVKTDDEISAIEAVLNAPRFVHGERLTVEFLTTPQTVARLLPPPLRAVSEPLAVAGIGRWESNGVGTYRGGSVSLVAEHDGVIGGCAIGMWMDSEPAVTMGRDIFGEPKKLATSALFYDGGRAHAWIERRGVRLVDLRAELGDDLGPDEVTRYAFNYRSRSAPDGIGLEGPATMTRATFRTTIKSRHEGRGAIAFTATVHDPLDDIEVVSVIRAEYQRHDIVARCEAAASVPAEQFLAFHHGRSDNWLALDSAAEFDAALG